MTDDFPTLQTRRLQLRQFRPEDIHNVFCGLSHPDVIRYYGVHFDTLEATQEQIDWFAGLEAGRTGIWWAICLAEDGAFLGAAGFNNWQQEHRKAEIGFWLLPGHWGKGIMSEALPLACDYGFGKMNLHRIEAFVESENRNSKKAMSKLGFSLEGTMVDCEIKNGRFISLDIYARLAPGSSLHRLP